MRGVIIFDGHSNGDVANYPVKVCINTAPAPSSFVIFMLLYEIYIDRAIGIAKFMITLVLSNRENASMRSG